jgi:sarcosine oxidase / L-pipecolate oxidase
MMSSKSSPIIIAGAGAWGLSTALHLVNAGHTNITVFDRATDIPSRYSGGYDLNKIVRAEYEDPFYTDLALEAIKQWRTPLFGPYYHHTGYVVAATHSAPAKAIHHLEAALSSVQDHPTFKPFISSLDQPQDFKDIFWQFTGPASFKGYINRYAGYAHSANAMKGIYRHLTTRGVRFVLGDAGRISELLYKGSPRRCHGVRTSDGTTHSADLVIVCLGAYAAELIPQVGKFAVAKSWSVAHVQLTEKECDYLRGIPVLNIRDLGFFFEPDPATRLFKICPLGAGYINTDKKSGVSLPPLETLPAPQDHIPIEDEKKLRRLLRETFPWMADRPFVDQKMCWFSDTADSEYCVDFVPDTDRSVVVLSGDSGHGFKMMPIVGSWVLELLKNGQQNLQRWQWKAVTEESGKAWGDAVSWRIGQTKEIQDVIDEQARVHRARL